MTDIARQRAIVRASLDIPDSKLTEATHNLERALHAHAVYYAGEMPTKSAPEWRAWSNRVEAFEWLVSQRLYRGTKGP